MLESQFSTKFFAELREMFPGIMILKNDASYIPGIPDTLLLYNNKWAALEFKRSKKAAKKPNQEYYINYMNNMSYAAFVYPENSREVMNELCKALGYFGPARVSIGE